METQMLGNDASPAKLAGPGESAGLFMKSGRWATERMMKAVLEGRPFSPKELRSAGVLRKEEWIESDKTLIMETTNRLRGVADLVAAGLVRTIPNGMAKTVLQSQKISDIDPAVVSMSGINRSENDMVDLGLVGLPLPITHKDWYLDLRVLLASRQNGEGLDQTMTRLSGRKIAEKIEQMLFLGGPTFAGLPIYGYTNVPNRNLANFESTGGLWSAVAKTGAQMLADVITGLTVLQGDQMFGPYGIYLPTSFGLPLENDFKANGDKSIRERILALDGVKFLTVADQMLADHIVIVQLTSDVVELVEGEPLQTVQWDVDGGFRVNFKALTIQVPNVKQGTYANRSGICVMGLNATGEATPVAPTGGE